MASLSLWFSTWSSRAGYRCMEHVNELTVGWPDVSYLIKKTFGVLRPCYRRKLGPFHFISQSTIPAFSCRSLRQWRARRANIKSWIIASLCKKLKAAVHIGMWLPTNWDTPYTKYSPEGENRQTPIIALPSSESALGFQEIVVKSKEYFWRRKRNPYIKEHISDFIIPFREIRKSRFLGAVQDCILSELNIDKDTRVHTWLWL